MNTNDPRPARGNQAAGIASLAREVARLRRQLETHEREHQAAEHEREKQTQERARLRRTTRRYWVTTIATVIGSNLATVLVLVLGRKA